MSGEPERLLTRIDEIAEQVVERMYHNPFWERRFAARGRQFALEDNRHHIRYLCEALRLGSPALLDNYAVWLRSVLTTRGMCTRHLAENFIFLSEAVRGDAPQAAAYLEDAQRALTYPSGVQRTLQLRAAEIAASDDAAYLLSYLADALEQQRDDVFTDYTNWIAGDENGRARIRSAADSLREKLDRLSIDGRAAAQRLLDRAVEQLDHAS